MAIEIHHPSDSSRTHIKAYEIDRDELAAIAKAGANSKGVLETPPEEEYREYVTHIIHLAGPGTPAVDKERLRGLGIETIRVYGRRNEGEAFVRYDERGLIQALEVTMGKRDPRVVSRRNTMMEGSAR